MCILVLRLQGPIQLEAAVTIIMKVLESNPMLFPIYNNCNVKTVKNFAVNVAQETILHNTANLWLLLL